MEPYLQHCPAVLESYRAPVEIHPQPAAETPPRYEGERPEKLNFLLEPQESVTVGMFVLGSDSPTGRPPA